MSDQDGTDRFYMHRARMLAREAARDVASEEFAEALYALDPDAVVLRMQVRSKWDETPHRHRAKVVVAVRGKRRVLWGNGKTPHEARMNAIRGGFQQELPF
jgi:hypothetical protein